MSGLANALQSPWKANVAALWRACELPRQQQADTGTGIGTGFPTLDAALANRGWPQAGLMELLCDDHGIGELRLLSPALAALSSAGERCVAWINPPHIPYAPALQAAGIDPARMLLIYPKDHREALWALEQTLKTGACGAVLGWPSERRLRFAEIRRLQFAAKQGRTWASLFRPARVAGEASAAELRLRLQPLPDDRLRVDIVKRRGGWPLSNIELTLGTTLTQQRRLLRKRLERWRGHRDCAMALPAGSE